MGTFRIYLSILLSVITLSDTAALLLEWAVFDKDHIEILSSNHNDLENEKAEESEKEFVFNEIENKAIFADKKPINYISLLGIREQFSSEVESPPPDQDSN